MAATATHAPLTTGLWYLGLFGVGAFVMRGAGCIINDMWDSRMDAAVGTSPVRLANGRKNQDAPDRCGRSIAYFRSSLPVYPDGTRSRHPHPAKHVLYPPWRRFSTVSGHISLHEAGNVLPPSRPR